MKAYKFDEDNHIHSLDGRPLMGTSTVVGVIAKPLTWWAAGLAVKQLGWQNSKEVPQLARLESAGVHLLQIKDMDAAQYLTLLDKAYRAHADTLTKSADKGTDMHAELEKYVKFCISDNEGRPIVTSVPHEQVVLFSDWVTKNVKRFLVSEGHCYSEKLWTGGISDLLFEDNQGRLGIMDFKSSKEAYLSQFFQIAGYDIAIGENGLFDKNGNQIYKPERSIDYYAVFPFGMQNPAPQFHFDTEGARKGFEAATVLHKLINNN